MNIYTNEGEMFGYLNLSGVNKFSTEYRIFKKYYCDTCGALRNNYGRISTLILNYDLVILPLVLSHKFDVPTECPKCNFKEKKKEEYNSYFWKAIAAFNLSMVEVKFIDNLNDERRMSLKNRTVYLLLKRAFQKAKNDFPLLFEKSRSGINRVYNVEILHKSLEKQSEAFGDMCLEMLETVFDLTYQEKNFFEALSHWLCFIDAVDDYDKDRKKGNYNPLIDSDLTKNEYVSTYYMDLFFKYSSIYERLKTFYTNASDKKIYSCSPVLKYLIYVKIPSVTAKTIQKRSSVYE